MDASSIALLYADCVSAALPFATVWFLCDLVVSTLLRVAFGGNLEFRR